MSLLDFMTLLRARFIYLGRRDFITNIDHQSHDTLSRDPNRACADGVIICDGRRRAPGVSGLQR